MLKEIINALSTFSLTPAISDRTEQILNTTDRDAIASDWKAVGDDMRVVINDNWWFYR